MKNIILIIGVFLISCNKVDLDVPKGTPRCVKKQIKKNLSEEDIASPLMWVVKYMYGDGKESYLFYHKKKNQNYFYYYDDRCNNICTGGSNEFAPSSCNEYSLYSEFSINNDTIWKRD